MNRAPIKPMVADIRAVNYHGWHDVPARRWRFLPWSFPYNEINRRMLVINRYSIQVRRAGHKDWEDIEIVDIYPKEDPTK